jgi:DHA2 family multidrug resistance protein
MSSIVWRASFRALLWDLCLSRTLALGTLANEQMGNASGVFNLMRNTGGSIGIALVTTMLARGAQLHQAAMVSHLTPYDPAVQQQVRQLGGSLATQGGLQQAYGAMYGALLRQASVMAYIDNFRLLSFLCVLCVPAALLFERATAPKGAVPMH